MSVVPVIPPSAVRSANIDSIAKKLPLTQEHLFIYFGDKPLKKGMDLYSSGHILNISIKEEIESLEISSSCKSSDGQTCYEQNCTIRSGKVVSSVCSCQYIVACKHAAAQILFIAGGLDSLPEVQPSPPPQQQKPDARKKKRKRSKVIEDSSDSDNEEPPPKKRISESRQFIAIAESASSGTSARVTRRNRQFA
jgi:hypothetical protein